MAKVNNSLNRKPLNAEEYTKASACYERLTQQLNSALIAATGSGLKEDVKSFDELTRPEQRSYLDKNIIDIVGSKDANGVPVIEVIEA